MCKLVILLTCLVCLTAAGRLGLERKLHWLQNLQHPMTGQDNKMATTAEQMPVANRRQMFLLDILLQVQKPLLNVELIDMGKMLVNQPEMYLEMDDDLLLFLEQCREHEILGRNELYNDLNIEHGRQLLGLYKFLVLARDWTTFQRNVCFARLHMNPMMLVNALQMAIRVRADTQELVMPALNEIMPQLFYDRDVIAAAQNVDWLNLINGKPMATLRPGLIDVLGLRGLGAGLGMRLASQTAGLWRPWQEWRMKMMNDRMAMRGNVMGGIMGTQLGGMPHLALISGGRSVVANDDDNNQNMIEEQQMIVVPVVQTLNEMSSLTDDVDLNIFWNNVMTERLMQTMSGGKHQKPLGGAGKMWNINNRMTDIGDLTLDEVLKIQQSHQQGIWKRTTGVWGEHQGDMNENTEGEDNWPTEQDNEAIVLSSNAWMGNKLMDKNNKGKQWTPIRTLDDLPVSDVSNKRLLRVNRRKVQQHQKTNRMMDNIWNRNMDDETRQTQVNQRQGVWNQRNQDMIEDDVNDSTMGHIGQVTMNPMWQGRWSHIGNGRMVADSDERRNHGRQTSEQERAEINRSRTMQHRPRGEQDNDEGRITGRWNTGRWTGEQDQVSNIERMQQQRMRSGQDNDEVRNNRWNTNIRDNVLRWGRIIEGKNGNDNMWGNNDNTATRKNQQMRTIDNDNDDERRNINWSNNRHNIMLDDSERQMNRHTNDDDNERHNINWSNNRHNIMLDDSERQMNRHTNDDDNERHNINWSNNRHNIMLDDSERQMNRHTNVDDNERHNINWSNNRHSNMLDDSERQMNRHTNDDDNERRNINWSNNRHSNMLDDSERQMNRHTNDDDNWVRHPRSINTMDLSNVMNTPADELMRLRSGEIFIQNMQQMLARINMDKLALNLESTHTVDDSVMSMMNPRLLTTSGVAYQQRAMSEAGAKQSVRRAVQDLKSIIELVLERKQIDKRSDDVMRIIGDILIEPIEDEGNGVGNLWDALYAQVNRDVYGIDAEQANTATVLSIATGNLREPIYQDIVNELLQLVNEYQSNLRPYTREELGAPGVVVNDIDIDRLVTYAELVDSDLINLVDQQLLQSNTNNLLKLQKRVVARQQRLNHQAFTITLDIESQSNQRVVVRTFLGPKMDATGRPIRVSNLNEMRQDFVQLDAFMKNLVRGTNIFQRQSRDITWTAHDVSTLSEIYHRVMMGQSLLELQGANCQFPQHLLIPRGTVDGMPVQLLVVVTPVSDEDRLLEQLVQSTTTRLCGLGNAAMNLDRRPLGFPLDRPISGQAQSLPNILLKDVIIEHESRVHGGRV